MSKISPFFLVVLLFCSAGMYGCTHQKGGAASAKMRDMETRYTKLEEDFRVVTASNDANRKKLTQTEADKAALVREVEELRAVTQERDELRKQLVTRTSERDTMQAQLTQFRQDLQSLVSRVDAALIVPGTTGTPVTAIPASRKSE